jgi:type I restriction enzyme S subunit
MSMQMATLESICTCVSSGGTPSRKRPEYFTSDTSGHLWVKSKELLDCSIDDTEEKITDEGLSNSSAKFYPENTVLVAMYGANVGQLGWLRRPATVNQAICGLIIDEEQADWRYVFYSLLLNRGDLTVQAQGAAQQNLNQDLIRQFELPIPPLPFQRRIAAILSAYDELIENNRRRIRILEDMARSLYREWFVHFRYPGHESVPLVGSPLGQIPQGWEVKKLRDIAVVNRTQINAKTAPDELHYIDIASVSPGQIDYVTTYAFADAPGRARRVVQHGDVLWSCVRPNRRSHALVMHPETNTIASTGFAVLTAKTVPYTFLYFATTTDDFVSYLTNNASGAAYPAVTATTFEKAELLVPSPALLERFGEATIAMTEQAHTLQRQTANLRSTRDLLLPRLLSGGINIQVINQEECHV